MNNIWSRRAFLASSLAASSLAGPSLAQSPASSIHRIYPRGAKVPANLAERAQAQRGAAIAVTDILRSNRRFMNAAGAMLAETSGDLPPQFDWRNLNRIPTIRSQQGCGSCWVFAAIGAYEGAYLVSNRQDAVVGGVDTIHVSEQQSLDCTYVEMDCSGGWHEAVLLYFKFMGGIEAADYDAYSEQKNACRIIAPARPYWLVNWGYVADENAPVPYVLPTTDALKRAVMKGPVVTAIATGGWNDYWRTNTDGSPYEYWPENGVFEGAATSYLKPCNIDHEVVIVGWDDDLGVWLIRNSWGPEWGENGYMKLRYDRHYVGFGASWLTVAPNNAISPALSARLNATAQSDPLRSYYPSSVF